ncbi:McrC family protein [Natroniella acetigena]|uniref:McrC family protein n=1 Tax=Natroniella acetigena TaxID=52004 RepID=UPI002009EFCF|nr:McrC family protein [Natroniella acetigena]
MNIKCILRNENKTEYKIESKDNVEVKEGRYSLLFTNIPIKEKCKLKINNEYYDILNNSSYSLSIDLINNIGYFKYEILDDKNNSLFTFQLFSKTSKLAKRDFYRMLDFVANNNFWNDKQFVYYDKTNITHKIIDPLFLFNWINTHFAYIEELILKINKKANKDKTTKYKRSFSNSNKYNKKRTINHLRNNPELLIEDTFGNGIIKVGNKTFNPQTTIEEKIINNIKINEHLQILELLLSIYNFLNDFKDIFSHSRYNSIREQCKEKILKNKWMKRLKYLKNNTFLNNISVLDLKHIKRHPISQLQISNHMYGEIYKLYKDFINDYYEFIEGKNQNFSQHIKNIDKIYESFCCYLLADILELKFIKENFLISGKAFKNDKITLYYQSKPTSMEGWALNDTPDIILKHTNGNVIILDSKFKIRNGNVKGEDVQKLQAYLNNYFQNIGGILYPGKNLDSTIDKINNLYQVHHIPIYPWNKVNYLRLKKEIRKKIYNSLGG